MGAHDFTARPLTSRFAADAPWPIGSLILAVGLPQMLKSFVRRTKVPSAQLALMDFARIALGLDKDKAKRGTHTCIISGSFPLDVNKQTQQTCASPPTPNPPRSLVFMCFTRTRVSMRHVCRFYQMCCFPSASLVKAHSSLHCSSVLVLSITQPFPKCLHKQPGSLDDVPQPSLLPNHYIVLLGTSALSGRFAPTGAR
jgi:hypothetical protein